MKQYTGEDRARIEAILENGSDFVGDVIEDPSVLDQLPNGSEIVLTPLAGGITVREEVARTKRFAISLTGLSITDCLTNVDG